MLSIMDIILDTLSRVRYPRIVGFAFITAGLISLVVTGSLCFGIFTEPFQTYGTQGWLLDSFIFFVGSHASFFLFLCGFYCLDREVTR